MPRWTYVATGRIRSYDVPNGTGRYSVAQCYDKTWATLAQLSKKEKGQYCKLLVTVPAQKCINVAILYN